jgi:hypothetical protein
MIVGFEYLACYLEVVKALSGCVISLPAVRYRGWNRQDDVQAGNLGCIIVCYWRLVVRLLIQWLLRYCRVCN